MNQKNDPIGQAILDFSESGKSKDIIVMSDLCEDDVIPSEYLFRTYEALPEAEKIALTECFGTILDVGAGAGTHSKILIEKGFDVTALEPSLGAVKHLESKGINVFQNTFQSFEEHQYDTILMLMNGIGLAGKLENLEHFLIHSKSLIKPGGQLICDSTDIIYLYEEEDGALWVDLNAEYYGNFKFQMSYKDHQSEWFDWLYVDYNRLKNTAEKVGFDVELLFEEDNHYLVKLKLK